MPSITVAVCTAGVRNTLGSSLRSVALQMPRPDDLEIVVVDNSRTEVGFVREVVAEVSGMSPVPLRYVREQRVGLGFARNAAIAAARGDVIAFLDDDAIADPDWTAGLLQGFTNPTTAVVGGRVDPIWEAERPAWLSDDLLAFLSILDYGPRQMRCTFPHYPFGVNIAFRRSVVQANGGFATGLGGGGAPTYLMDEIEVCRRIERSGGTIIYTPAARVRHLVPASRMTRGFFLQRALILGRATARMGWQSSERRPSLAGCVKGEVLAAGRTVRHGARALSRLVRGRGAEFVSESRHVAWNLAWMWETGVLVVEAPSA